LSHLIKLCNLVQYVNRYYQIGSYKHVKKLILEKQIGINWKCIMANTNIAWCNTNHRLHWFDPSYFGSRTLYLKIVWCVSS
jgi:hypothetical protein